MYCCHCVVVAVVAVVVVVAAVAIVSHSKKLTLAFYEITFNLL